MNYILETNKLTKQYGRQKAVNGVDMHIKQGAIYGFIGRNGAGKTTLLKMACGMAAPTSGEITLFGCKGKDIGGVMNRVGVLIEAPGLYPGMTAYDNMKLKCKAAGINKEGYIDNILKLVGLEKVGKKKAGCFSLGMKQRLGIGMALVGEPDILLLDEPINGLDPQGIAEVRETLLKLNHERNITIVISSHILEELSKIATDYGIINNGVLLEELTNEELFSRCKERITITLNNPEEAIPVLDKMGFKSYKMVDNETIEIYERLNEIPDIIIALAKKEVRIESITKRCDAIEDYFIKLTGGNANA